jgi:hypothetical protein
MPTKKPTHTASKQRVPSARRAALPTRSGTSGPARKSASVARKTAPVARKAAASAAPIEAPPAAASKAEAKEPKKAAKARPKLVRDSFTMPEPDFAVIATLKAAALSAQRVAKKSELLRAGLRVLATLDTAALVAALEALEPVQTGRPKKGH